MTRTRLAGLQYFSEGQETRIQPLDEVDFTMINIFDGALSAPDNVLGTSAAKGIIYLGLGCQNSMVTAFFQISFTGMANTTYVFRGFANGEPLKWEVYDHVLSPPVIKHVSAFEGSWIPPDGGPYELQVGVRTLEARQDSYIDIRSCQVLVVSMSLN